MKLYEVLHPEFLFLVLAGLFHSFRMEGTMKCWVFLGENMLLIRSLLLHVCCSVVQRMHKAALLEIHPIPCLSGRTSLVQRLFVQGLENLVR